MMAEVLRRRVRCVCGEGSIVFMTMDATYTARSQITVADDPVITIRRAAPYWYLSAITGHCLQCVSCTLKNRVSLVVISDSKRHFRHKSRLWQKAAIRIYSRHLLPPPSLQGSLDPPP